MNMSKMGIEITFTTPILGSSPADPEIHSRYIASRAPSPWQSKEVELLEYKSKKEEGELTLDTLTELLDYGAYHGLGQWRNGGYGQFTWRRLDRG